MNSVHLLYTKECSHNSTGLSDLMPVYVLPQHCRRHSTSTRCAPQNTSLLHFSTPFEESAPARVCRDSILAPPVLSQHTAQSFYFLCPIAGFVPARACASSSRTTCAPSLCACHQMKSTYVATAGGLFSGQGFALCFGSTCNEQPKGV